MALFERRFPPFMPFGRRILRRTLPPMRGTDVAILQVIYNTLRLSLAAPPGDAISIDGIFGLQTETAVRRTQAYFGSPVDGTVGPATYALLGQVVDGAGPAPAFGSRPLQPGVCGDDVTVLQNRLNCFRYAALIGAPASGTFDQATAAAVEAFKQDAVANGQTDLAPNPVVGDGALDAGWLYTAAGGRTLGHNGADRGYDVAFVQAVLTQLGLYGGPVSGFYDVATELAVQAFQSRQGITPDGIVGPATFYQIGLVNSVPAPAPFPVVWPTPARVSVCSVALASQTGDLHPYGIASHVINLAEGFESLDVTANFLPDPAHFGVRFGQYGFSLTDPVDDAVIASELMVRTPSPAGSDWAGSFSPGVKTIPQGIVSVYPVTASGIAGPVVLRGNLGHCR